MWEKKYSGMNWVFLSLECLNVWCYTPNNRKYQLRSIFRVWGVWVYFWTMSHICTDTSRWRSVTGSSKVTRLWIHALGIISLWSDSSTPTLRSSDIIIQPFCLVEGGTSDSWRFREWFAHCPLQACQSFIFKHIILATGIYICYYKISRSTIIC